MIYSCSRWCLVAARAVWVGEVHLQRLSPINSRGGLHPPGARLGSGPANGYDLRLLRRCRNRIILGQNAKRTLEHETMENEDQTGQRHVRVPRDLPQSPKSAQCSRDAGTDRVRERTLHTPTRSLKSTITDSRNSGHIKVSGNSGAIHDTIGGLIELAYCLCLCNCELCEQSVYSSRICESGRA